MLPFSCTQESVVNTFQKSDHHIVTRLGDSIPSGVPILVRGSQIEPDSVAKSKTVSLSGRPKKVPLQTNVYPIAVLSPKMKEEAINSIDSTLYANEVTK